MSATFRIAILSAAILIMLIGYLAVGMMSGGDGLSLLEPNRQDRIAAAAMRFNAEGSREFENGSRFDHVTALPGGMRYQFTLMYLSSSEVDPREFQDVVYEGSRVETCRNPVLLELMKDENLFVEAVFNGNDDVMITSFRIDIESCTGGV